MPDEADQPDPYDLLGIPHDANEARIRKAWRKKTKATGPGTSAFAAVNDAAELLLDSERRAAYDRSAEPSGSVAEASNSGDESVEQADDVAPKSARTKVLSGWWGTTVLAGVLAVVAIVLVVWQGVVYRSSPKAGPGTGGVSASNFDQPQSVQQAVLSTVQTGLPAVLSYRYDQMQANLTNAKRFLTAHYQSGLETNYQRLIQGGTVPGCKDALKPIADTKLVVATTWVAGGIISVTSKTAEVGAFVNTTSTEPGQAAVTHQNRVEVMLQKVGGQWLIDSMSVPNTDHVLSC